ncbi:hypothetical protein SLA2020_426880 [Shorea laevis]
MARIFQGERSWILCMSSSSSKVKTNVDSLRVSMDKDLRNARHSAGFHEPSLWIWSLGSAPLPARKQGGLASGGGVSAGKRTGGWSNQFKH